MGGEEEGASEAAKERRKGERVEEKEEEERPLFSEDLGSPQKSHFGLSLARIFLTTAQRKK